MNERSLTVFVLPQRWPSREVDNPVLVCLDRALPMCSSLSNFKGSGFVASLDFRISFRRLHPRNQLLSPSSCQGKTILRGSKTIPMKNRSLLISSGLKHHLRPQSTLVQGEPSNLTAHPCHSMILLLLRASYPHTTLVFFPLIFLPPKISYSFGKHFYWVPITCLASYYKLETTRWHFFIEGKR